MTTFQIVITIAAYLLAGTIKGISGMGYATTALPILTLAFGLHAAMPLILLPTLASNIYIMRTVGHFRETLWRYLPLYLAMAVGLVIGLWLMRLVEQHVAAALLGTVIVAYCIAGLIQPNYKLPAKAARALQVPVGIANGVINGVTGSQVMPFGPYLLAVEHDPEKLLQALTIGFTMTIFILLVGLGHAGTLNAENVIVSLLGTAPTMLGVWAGSKLRLTMSTAVFRRVVLVVLLCLGIILLARAV